MLGEVLGGALALLTLSRLLRPRGYQGGPIAFGTHPKVTRDFLQATIETAKAIGADPADLLTTVFSEYGFEHDKFTPEGAGGLIGFMPATLKQMGRTASQLQAESAAEQMRRDVKDFFIRFGTAGRLRDVTQTKLAVFYPKAMGASLGAVIASKDGQSSFGDSPGRSRAVYSANVGSDRNHDGKITVGDIDSHIRHLKKIGETQFFGLPKR